MKGSLVTPAANPDLIFGSRVRFLGRPMGTDAKTIRRPMQRLIGDGTVRTKGERRGEALPKVGMGKLSQRTVTDESSMTDQRD